MCCISMMMYGQSLHWKIDPLRWAFSSCDRCRRLGWLAESIGIVVPLWTAFPAPDTKQSHLLEVWQRAPPPPQTTSCYSKHSQNLHVRANVLGLAGPCKKNALQVYGVYYSYEGDHFCCLVASHFFLLKCLTHRLVL